MYACAAQWSVSTLSPHCSVTCTVVKASCLKQESYHDVLIGCKIFVIK